jgi:GTP cyclohydrolase I
VATILPGDHEMVTDSPMDLDAVEQAAAVFLTALGVDLDREHRRATPARMARAYAELLETQPFRLTTFRAFGATTVTSAMLGTLRTDYRSRAEFFALADVRTSPGTT